MPRRNRLFGKNRRKQKNKRGEKGMSFFWTDKKEKAKQMAAELKAKESEGVLSSEEKDDDIDSLFDIHAGEETAHAQSSSAAQVEEKEPEPPREAEEGSLEWFLEKVVGQPARSNKHGFKETAKLEEVERLLAEAESPYHLVRKSDNSWIFGQKEMEDGANVLLVSTHSDIVDNIKNPHSKRNMEKDYYRGTYDNAGTNAVCAHLMASEELPESVYFAFTADEETGRCNGAADALAYVRQTTGREPVIFALDVTDEGYDTNRLFTVEGLHGVNEMSRRKMLELFLSTEGEKQSFEVVPLKKKDDNSFLPKSYQSDSTTMFDESCYYAKEGCNSCSLCLPGDGEMHGDDGFKVKRAVMEGYEKSLLLNIYTFEHFHPERVEELKAEKDRLVGEAKATSFWKKTYSSYSYGGSYNGPYTHSFRDASGYNSYEHAVAGISGYRGSSHDSYMDRAYERFSPVYDEDYMLQQAEVDAYEIAAAYGADEFEPFFDDMVHMYGLRRTREIEATFRGIFKECMEMKDLDFDEEEEYGSYDDNGDEYDPYAEDYLGLDDIDDYGIDMD